MELGEIAQSYGYAALAAGTFLEGETMLVAAGFAARRGYLDLPAVIVVATIASFLGDQLFFWVGRRHGAALFRRYPSLARRGHRVAELLARYHLPFILSLRFLYGLRIAGPIAVGISGVAWERFLLLNLLGALIWASLIGGAGYAFGQGMEYVMADLRRYEGRILLGIVMLGAIGWTASRMRRASKCRAGTDESSAR